MFCRPCIVPVSDRQYFGLAGLDAASQCHDAALKLRWKLSLSNAVFCTRERFELGRERVPDTEQCLQLLPLEHQIRHIASHLRIAG